MEERKCFECREFSHIASNYRNVGKEEPAQVPQNRYEVLKDKVIQRGEGSSKEIVKDRREILRKEKAKRKEKREKRKERSERPKFKHLCNYRCKVTWIRKKRC